MDTWEKVNMIKEKKLKAETPVLNEAQINGLRNWLDFDRKDENCPFGNNCLICLGLLKHFAERSRYHDHCPCGCYSEKYLIAFGRKVLKEYEKNPKKEELI